MSDNPFDPGYVEPAEPAAGVSKAPRGSGVRYHRELVQGSDEWHQARCGLLTASEVKLILTPTLKVADNDKTRAHVYELLAQRISNYVEPSYIGDEMLRGYDDEIEARAVYSKRYAPVEECGFVTNDRFGFTVGCSPDGLVGDDGLIECKSRRQKFQVQTIADHVAAGTIPDDYVLQVQTELLVTERKWCDFISYSGGLPMVTIRVFPDERVQAAIVEAATAFEARIAEKRVAFEAAIASGARLIPTERRIEQEMIV
jgi:predicted phage-related endonuclease